MNLFGICLLLMQVQLASADGVVTKPGGAAPLAGATVSLVPVANDAEGSRLRSVATEEDGRFRFENIEPGDYRLTADSPRYGRVAYGQRREDGPGSIVALGPGQQLSGLRLSMTPTGAIAGRVTGRNGEPVVNASVQALKYAYRDGRKILVPAQATATDDRGEYRLFWLPPGRYLVAAALSTAMPYLINPAMLAGRNIKPGFGSQGEVSEYFEFNVIENLLGASVIRRTLEDGAEREEAWVPVYYPSAMEPRLATAVDVAADATLNGVNLALEPARVQRVRGSVTGFTPGSPPTVTLQPLDAVLGMRAPVVGSGASSTDGSFGFDGVLPGSYYLTANDSRTGLASMPIAVTVENSDVEGLSIGMTPALRLEGKIVIEGPSSGVANAPLLSDLMIWLQPDLPGIPAQPAGRVQPADGSFTLNLPPGNYVLRVNTPTEREDNAPPLFVKAMRYGGADALDGIQVTPAPQGRLEIALTMESGAIQGVARDARGAVTPGATVVLVPDVGRKQPGRYKSAVAGPDGSFRLSGIAPGSYNLFAWNDVETGAWQDADFLRAFESRGRAIVVADGGSDAVELQTLDVP